MAFNPTSSRQPHRRGERIPAPCPNCGKMVTTGRIDKIYCSSKCYTAHWMRTHPEYKNRNYVPTGNPRGRPRGTKNEYVTKLVRNDDG